MATKTLPTREDEAKPRISTFAVIDLETTGLPAHNSNRVSITELCIFAFDPKTLKQNEELTVPMPPYEPTSPFIPAPPRVLHKLNLLFRPGMLIDPRAENITGLDNFLLERESRLDENAAQMILKFLEHLPAPVCLVSHNGWNFDYPILKQAFDKLNLQLPASLLCVDSLRAFLEIDEKRNDLETKLELEVFPEVCVKSEPAMSSPISKEIDWQKLNETTPKRPTQLSKAYRKRKFISDDSEDEDGNETELSSEAKRPRELHVRRQLFSGLKCSENKRYPPRGRYKLCHMFERIFLQPAYAAHQAEADVNMLTKLIQHYGVDFLAFAEEQSIPFAQVAPLGSK